MIETHHPEGWRRPRGQVGKRVRSERYGVLGGIGFTAAGSRLGHWVDGLERTQEFAHTCPDSRVVTVCDREGGFRDLNLHAEQTGAA